MSKQHYRYSPSATKRWLNCPGSLDAPPTEESIHSLEGTAAHALGERALRGESIELPDAVKVYVNYVNQLRTLFQPHFELVEDTRVHPVYDDLGGTADYMAVYDDPIAGTVLHLVDYKNGEGVPVIAVENEQQLTYAVIFAPYFGSEIDTYRLTIIQPRCIEVDPIQTWDTTPERVAQHAEAITSIRGKTHFKAGNHCRWCSLAPTCETLRAESLRIAQIQFEQADVEDLLKFYTMGDAIRAALNDLQAVLIEKARLGCELPGYKVVESLGHRKWAAPQDKILRRLAKLGIKRKQAIETKLQSPAALEELLDKEARKGAFDGLITREKIGLRVVPESARGEPMLLSVEQVFKDAPE